MQHMSKIKYFQASQENACEHNKICEISLQINKKNSIREKQFDCVFAYVFCVHVCVRMCVC